MNRIAHWRKQRGMTQSELAKAIRVNQSYMSELENSVKRGYPELYLKIANALNVTVDDLFRKDT